MNARLVLTLLAIVTNSSHAQVATVEVISSSPVPGSGTGISRDKVPAPVQTATGSDIEQSGSANLADFMNRRLGSVHINETQGNAFQPDVNYRGFTASPLLGTPQGISLYMDGVRLNQPFGDVVSWDLIPRGAISSIVLMPGSNPVFGLNTLGGALSIQTKDGRSAPGTFLDASLGRFGHRLLAVEHGGSNEKGLDWFITANGLRDGGWRVDSPSNIGQLFGKLGWRNADSKLALTISSARTKLHGNGLQEQSLLAQDYRSVYTRPDTTHNKSTLLNLTGQHALSGSLLLAGNIYYRTIHTTTLNGDVNQDAFGNTPVTAASCAAELALVGAGGEPVEQCNGLINRSQTKQSNWGFNATISNETKLGGFSSQWLLGAGLEASRMHFTQSTEIGLINADRSITGQGAFGDGVTGGELNGAPFDNRIDLKGRSKTVSLFATSTTALSNEFALTLAGRFNHTTVANTDNITPGGGPGSLDGNHRFSRFNPALGFTYAISPSLNTYAGYNESSRAPTAIELGCADPTNECKLPNSMAGDPPLKQVVSKTIDIGLRGTVNRQTRWNIGAFQTINYDDIQFVAGATPGYGYFRNFGKTQRSGVEAGVHSNFTSLRYGINYTYLKATYQSAEQFSASANSSNSVGGGLDGNISVVPGDRIPLIPKQMLKFHANYQFSPEWNIGFNIIAIGGSLARGNENGQHQADGVTYFGPGKSPGYALTNATARFQPTKKLTFSLHVSNLFDRRFSTAAQLGTNAFDNAGNFQASPLGSNASGTPLIRSTFYAPGATRIVTLGMRYQF